MMPGGPDFGARAELSPELRAEFAKRIEQARERAEAAWKKVAAMRDQYRKELAQKPEAELKKERSKKPKPDAKPSVAKRESAEKQAAKKPAGKPPREKKPPRDI